MVHDDRACFNMSKQCVPFLNFICYSHTNGPYTIYIWLDYFGYPVNRGGSWRASAFP